MGAPRREIRAALTLVAGDEVVLGHRALGTRFAMSVIRLNPAFVFLLVGQRYLVKGIATSSRESLPRE